MTPFFRKTAAAAVAAAGLGAGALLGPATPSASAAPDPCAASELAKTVAMVATNTGNYLAANPQADQALTTISQQQGGPQSVAALKAYFDANPKVAGDMQRLQAPIAALSGRCKLPITMPQILGLMQAAQQAQQPGAAPAAGLPGAQAVGVDTSAPVQRTPASTPGVGPLPGPAATSSQ